jgi:hypothetical protein
MSFYRRRLDLTDPSNNFGDIIPRVNNVNNLGSLANFWNNLYSSIANLYQLNLYSTFKAQIFASSAATGNQALTMPPQGTANLAPEALTSTVTSGTTVVLTVTGNPTQVFTGSTAQTITLPPSAYQGQRFYFINNSSASLTINVSGSGLVKTVAAGASTTITALSATPTTAAGWYAAAS